MKAGIKRRIIRILGWIALGFLTLILLITVSFYLGRGWILNRAVGYINNNQPGEVQMGQMNLIPFVNFPDVSLNLHNVNYYEREVHPDSLYQEPILSLDEINVTLDVFDLIRGDITIAEAKLNDGFVRLEMYEDSLINIEKALGIRFGEGGKKDTLDTTLAMQVDLDKLEVNNILALMGNHLNGDHFRLRVNQLESRFRYHPGLIDLGIKLNIDVDQLKYFTFKLETSKNITLESEISVLPEKKEIILDQSNLGFSGLQLETSGMLDYSANKLVDIKFEASNTGLDLLNFIFRGVLDMNEIEQIGSGNIFLDGTVKGSFDKNLPLLQINGNADRIGFRIKSVEKDVTDISFNLHATNGNKLDFSEGQIKIDQFAATFPEGTIHADIIASNLTSPELDIQLSGQVDLEGMEQMIRAESFRELSGMVSLDGRIFGKVNRDSGEFLNDAGSMRAMVSEGGFILDQDTIREINGEVFIQKNLIGTNNLELNYNGNKLNLGLQVENLLLYLLGFNTDLRTEINLASEILYPDRLTSDSTITSMLGEELKGLHFIASAEITKQELDAFLKDDSVPTVQIYLDSFGVELPVYADISNMKASLTFGPDSISLHHLGGNIGESEFGFKGMVSNYGAITSRDSTKVVSVDYALSSDLMRAEDLFTMNGEFMLPETYQTEYLEDFRLAGSFQVPVYGLVTDSIPTDFDLSVWDLGWKFRYYPLEFKDFLINLRKERDSLIIDEFRGKVGESNLQMSANLGNISDSLVENIHGSLVLDSDLLDFNELLNYQAPDESTGLAQEDTSEVREPPRLDQINYPDFNFTLNLGEIRYGSYKIFGMNGNLRSSRHKILYLDELVTSTESGGQMKFNGQFNVSSPYYYTFSADLDLDNVDINDVDFELQSGDSVSRLSDNFQGIVSADGLAEVFITPDLQIDMSTTTAVFNLRLVDGALINFTPLQAAAKYLDNKNLNDVRFAMLRNSFTLVDSRVLVPNMFVESTVGMILIEGEQGLDNSYLYLVRVPMRLVKEAARNVFSNAGDDEVDDEIQVMEPGKFLRLTVWGDGLESDVKLGDKREKYLE